MQDYYNIPKYSTGGFLLKMVEKGLKSGAINYGGLQVQANSFSRTIPELKGLLQKLITSSKSGQKLSHEEGKKLIDLLQEHKGNYKSLNNLIPKNWERIKQKVDKITDKVAENTKQVKNTVKEATETQPTNPIPGTTLSSRWKQVKQWMNNHPKTVAGGALFLGSGTGRDILSQVGSLYSARPFNSATAADQQIVTINGVDIPITKSSNGKFIPIQGDDSQATPTSAGDDIDALINNARAEAETPDAQNYPQIADQETINDLFADDQDQWY